MAESFLDQLPISDEERKKLVSFGANSAYAILAMRKASKEAFDAYIGPERAEIIAGYLGNLLTPSEKESLSKPPKAPGVLGARLGPLVKPSSPSR